MHAWVWKAIAQISHDCEHMRMGVQESNKDFDKGAVQGAEVAHLDLAIRVTVLP